VATEGDPNVYLGRIARLSQSSRRRLRMLIVEAEVANDGSLRPGLFTRAEIVIDDDTTAVTIPTKSIVTRGH
jgi:hypothetical protein